MPNTLLWLLRFGLEWKWQYPSKFNQYVNGWEWQIKQNNERNTLISEKNWNFFQLQVLLQAIYSWHLKNSRQNKKLFLLLQILSSHWITSEWKIYHLLVGQTNVATAPNGWICLAIQIEPNSTVKRVITWLSVSITQINVHAPCRYYNCLTKY